VGPSRLSSSAAAKPAWPSATSWPGRAGASPFSKPRASRPPPGGVGGTRCSCSRRRASTACRGWRFPATPTATRGATTSSPTCPTLVVGGGNTGYQIAEELVRSRPVHLAIGARQVPLPQRLLGRDVFRYLEAMGLMRKTVDSRLAQRVKDKETLIGSSPRGAGKRGIRLRPPPTGRTAT